MKQCCLLLLFLMLTGFLSSCSTVLKKLYGIEDLKAFDPVKVKECERYMTDLYPSATAIISSDTSFKKFIDEFSEFNKNDVSQPIQILYFKNDSLISYHINCYAKGSLNGHLNWNYDGRMNSYPPKSAVQLSVRKRLSDLISIYEFPTLRESDVIVFFWSTLLNRQSKEAFKVIVDNIENSNFPDTNRKQIIIINIDKAYL